MPFFAGAANPPQPNDGKFLSSSPCFNGNGNARVVDTAEIVFVHVRKSNLGGLVILQAS
jgi:hypothetical protein